jgi:D-3-phosphoglycerate dehydrogenase
VTDRCRIGFAEDFLLADGSLSFPGYDLSPLRAEPGVEIVRIPAGARHAPADLEGLDLLVSVPGTAAIDGASLGGQSRLLGIVRVGVGCEDVDLAACTGAGVAVVLPSEAVRRPTAVAALALILALATRLVEKDRLSRKGPSAWNQRSSLRGNNIEGRVLGLLGCGSIGSDLARLVRPLGLRIVAFDPALSVDEAETIGASLTDLPGLLAQADILSIHCPLNERTRHLIDATAVARMKPGAWIVNTARGGIIEQSALAAALVSGRLGGAGLDVFEPEPLAPDDPLLAAPNLVLGGHALNWTEELDRDLADANIAALVDLLAGRVPRRLANPEVEHVPVFRHGLATLAARAAASQPAAPAPEFHQKGMTA